jgi:Uncharacterized membrane-associated protein/domain
VAFYIADAVMMTTCPAAQHQTGVPGRVTTLQLVQSQTRADPEAAAPTDGTPATEETAEDDLSLLSDEERVERLLEQNGGRMRQADIVSDTGWSDAKVSQLLSKMAQDDRVEKLRLGRENLISLPGHQGFDDTDPLDR